MNASTTTPLGALARGLAAGLAGTAAMTAYQEAVSRVKRRASSGSESGSQGSEARGGQRDPWSEAPAPAQVGRRILAGMFEREVPPERIGLVTNVVHWTYGTAWGSAYGLVQGTIRARPAPAGAVFGTAVWGASYVLLPAMNLYKPIWEYRPKTLALDLSYHLVYGLVVAAAYRRLEKL